MATEHAGGLNVGKAVAYPPGAREVDVERLLRLLKELGAGLPAVAGTAELRMMRAEVVGVDVRALLLQQFDQPPLHGRVVLYGVEPACDTGLIGDDNDEETALVEPFDGAGGAGKECDLARLMQESRVVDDRAVAIEKDRSASHAGPRLLCPPVPGKWCARRATRDCRRRAQ